MRNESTVNPLNEPETSYSDLQFFGAITASISHELNNVIGIVEQVAGLMEDQLIAFESGIPLKPESLARVADRINVQTTRGVEIIKRMNRFAHSIDEPFIDFDINAVLENFIAMMQRLAALKRTTLDADFHHEEIYLTSNPFLLQEVVFRVIKSALENSERDDHINLKTSKNENTISIEIQAPAYNRVDPDSRCVEGESSPLTRLHGHVACKTDESGNKRMLIEIPLKQCNLEE
ncbi:hypothetical protein K8I28_02010 [bacterium]|nr:hypothetical protein [bacterium]